MAIHSIKGASMRKVESEKPEEMLKGMPEKKEEGGDMKMMMKEMISKGMEEGMSREDMESMMSEMMSEMMGE